MPSFGLRAFHSGSNATALFLLWVPLTIDLGSASVVTFLSRLRGTRIVAPSVLRQRRKISKCRDICLKFMEVLLRHFLKTHFISYMSWKGIYFWFCFEKSTQTVIAWIRGTGRSGRRVI